MYLVVWQVALSFAQQHSKWGFRYSFCRCMQSDAKVRPNEEMQYKKAQQKFPYKSHIMALLFYTETLLKGFMTHDYGLNWWTIFLSSSFRLLFWHCLKCIWTLYCLETVILSSTCLLASEPFERCIQPTVKFGERNHFSHLVKRTAEHREWGLDEGLSKQRNILSKAKECIQWRGGFWYLFHVSTWRPGYWQVTFSKFMINWLNLFSCTFTKQLLST